MDEHLFTRTPAQALDYLTENIGFVLFVAALLALVLTAAYLLNPAEDVMECQARPFGKWECETHSVSPVARLLEDPRVQTIRSESYWGMSGDLTVEEHRQFIPPVWFAHLEKRNHWDVRLPPAATPAEAEAVRTRVAAFIENPQGTIIIESPRGLSLRHRLLLIGIATTAYFIFIPWALRRIDRWIASSAAARRANPLPGARG